jgi:xylulokinase
VFLGIDLGTSSAKALLLDPEVDPADGGRIVAEASAALSVSRLRPLWSEQDPRAWWAAVDTAVRALGERVPGGLGGVLGIGLSGQMHGATLLDAAGQPLRPAILWNDGRSSSDCEALERAVPESREITGNLAMPGFTAPKLLWVQREEPEVFARLARVLLPKDYLRLCMTGDYATDLSDASGTLWVDVAGRCWSERMLAACGLDERFMPSLHEGCEPTGRLRAEVASAWGCGRVPVVAGGGDNAAGAIGAGVVEPGRALLSLGTSGVYFVAGDRFRPNPERAVHAFCHALPDRWHQMSVLLSAASCLSWITRVTGAADEAALLAEVEASGRSSDALLFLPYLSGERTPHNDPHASGVFIGLGHETDRAALGRAVLEGVAYAFADAQEVLGDVPIESVSVIGGGARSALWGRILASALQRPLDYRRGGEVGPALGAARLARLGVAGEPAAAVCCELPLDFVAQPDPDLVETYAARRPRFQALYASLRENFRAAARARSEET